MNPSTSPARKRALASVAAAALVAAGALGASIEMPRGALAQALPESPIVAQANRVGSFADIVDKVKPAVVAVKVKLDGEAASDASTSNRENLPPQLREWFRRFGENGAAPQRREGGQALGSGFFVSADGYVVTNNHVVEHGMAVQVTMDDGRTLDAKVVGKDSKTDLALLKVTEAGTYPYVRLAGTAPRVGDWVVAIGNPFGLGGTVTAGIVSGRGRDIGAGPYDDFLQIDAPINKGNSGGPSFNLSGEVVGVNTAIASPSGGSVGLAFAIPAETVSTVVAQLKDGGAVARGYLGVQIQGLNRDLADGLGLSDTKGALVESAKTGTPAARAGLKSGDVIRTVDGKAIGDARELSRRIAALKPGAKVEIGYVRAGRDANAAVELGTQAGETRTAAVERRDGGRRGGGVQPRLGLELAPASSVGLADEGVAVVAVDPDGPAAAKGLREGDVILDVGGASVATPADVADRVRSAERDGRKAVLMRIKGQQGTRFVAIALPNRAG